MKNVEQLKDKNSLFLNNSKPMDATVNDGFVDPKYKREEGFVLVITLMLMMGLTLISLPAMQMSNLNMKIIQNENARETLRFDVQRAVDQIINQGNFSVGTSDFNIDGQTVSVTVECLFSKLTEGTGQQNSGPVMMDTLWEVFARASKNGVEIAMVQGVKIKIKSGACGEEIS